MFGTVAVFVMAVLLFVFSKVTEGAKGYLLWPGLFLTWSLVVIFVVSLGLITTSVFLGKPMPYPKLIHQLQPAKRVSITVTVEDTANGSAMIGAAATLLTPAGARKGFTDGKGKAAFQGVGVEEERLVARVSAAGYADLTTEFDLSDPTSDYIVKLNPLPEPQAVAPRPVKAVKKEQRQTTPTTVPAGHQHEWHVTFPGGRRH